MSSQSGTAILMCTAGELAGKKFELQDEALFIGVDAKKRLRVSSDPRELAERFVRISAKEGKFKLEAIAEAGLTVDGGAVTGTIPLERLHVISVQKSEFVFRRSAGPTPVATPAVAAPPPPTPPSPPPITAPRAAAPTGAPPAAPQQPPPPAPPKAPPPPMGTMIDAGGFGDITDPRLRRPAAPPPAVPPPTPPKAPTPPMGTMIDAGGFGDITDPRLKRPAAPPPPASPPPAPPPATPPAPLGTMIDAGGFGDITDPRRRRISNAPTAPASPAVLPDAGKETPPAPPAPAPPASRPGAFPNSEMPTAILPNLTPPGEFSPYELVTVIPGMGAKTYQLKYGDNVVGRGEAADIQVPDAQMVLSRRHAIIKVALDRIEIVDLKGQNGTYINGQRIESAVITPGTSFHLGILKFGLNRR